MSARSHGGDRCARCAIARFVIARFASARSEVHASRLLQSCVMMGRMSGDVCGRTKERVVMAGKFAPQIWGEASLQLSEFGELERGLPDFSKHVRSGECVKTRNRGGYFTGSIINDGPKWKKCAKNKKMCTYSSANTAP